MAIPQQTTAGGHGSPNAKAREDAEVYLRHRERSDAIQNPSAATVWIASLHSR